MNAELNPVAETLERFAGSTWAGFQSPEGPANGGAGTSTHASPQQGACLLFRGKDAMMLVYVSPNLWDPVGSGGDAGYLLDEARVWRSVTSTASWENLFSAFGKQVARTERPAKAQLPVLPAAELVAEVKATLGIKVTDLAAIAKVSRQTLYDWIDGGTISPKNYERLFALRQVCQEWQAMAKRPIGQLVHAKTEDQTSLLDLLQQDPLDQAAICALVETLAAKAVENEASLRRRASKLDQLSEKAYRENLLIHSHPATDS